MPEIAEGINNHHAGRRSFANDSVARVVHYLRKSLVGRTLKFVTAQDDSNVFGKVGTSGAQFQELLTGKKVLGAGQQGKYFWSEIFAMFHPCAKISSQAYNGVSAPSGDAFGNDR